MEELKSNKLVKVLMTVMMMVCGGTIVYYYWANDTLGSIIKVPIFVMVLAVSYILLQIAKRYLFQKQNWWDWLYYIGLLSIMLPTLMANMSSLILFDIITDFGTIFLLIPVILDGKQIIVSN